MDFEKEAEEYQTEKRKRFNKNEQLCWGDVYKDFKKGAEFGYQKGLKAKINTTTISDCPIKDEWHYVKDGDFPEEQQLVLLYRENSNGANVALAYWYKSYVNDKVIAWKEIVLPSVKIQ